MTSPIRMGMSGWADRPHGELRTGRRPCATGAVKRHGQRHCRAGRVNAQAPHGRRLACGRVEVLDVHELQRRHGPRARRELHRCADITIALRGRADLVGVVAGEVGHAGEAFQLAGPVASVSEDQ